MDKCGHFKNDESCEDRKMTRDAWRELLQKLEI